MANVLNRTTGVYLTSVNTPDFDEADWLVNPDLSAVQGIANHYWVIEGDIVREMTIEEKAAYDATHTVEVINRLSDGTPAYKRGNYVVSVASASLVFAIKTTGAKKFNVPYGTAGDTFVCDRNRLIANIGVSAKGSAVFDLIAKINGVEVQRFNVTAINKKFSDLEILISDGQELGFSIESNANVVNPVITVSTFFRN